MAQLALKPINPSEHSVHHLRNRAALVAANPQIIPTDLPEGQFCCGICLRIFPRRGSEEESLAEMRARFGEVPPDEQISLCDECEAFYMNQIARR